MLCKIVGSVKIQIKQGREIEIGMGSLSEDVKL
jgi:hypothetical protein